MVGLAPDGKVIARINSVPFTWTGSCDDDLPDQGWDAVLEGAFSRAHADGMPAISLPETRGLADVPGALAPVHVSVEQNHAVYVEPTLWMHHRVATDA